MWQKWYDYDKAILLIRNPCDACFSYFNYQKTKGGHRKNYKSSNLSEEFKVYLNECREKWRQFHITWNSKDNFQGEILKVPYEALLSNLESELHIIADFLNINLEDKNLECVLNENLIGPFKRRSTKVISDLIDKNMLEQCEMEQKLFT